MIGIGIAAYVTLVTLTLLFFKGATMKDGDD